MANPNHLRNVAHAQHVVSMAKMLRIANAELLERQNIKGARELVLILQTAEDQAKMILKRLTTPQPVEEDVTGELEVVHKGG